MMSISENNKQSTPTKALMRFSAITLFPQMYKIIADYGVIGRAINSGQVKLDLINPRDFTDDRHKTVDDKPYGGGPGMLMKAEPLASAIEFAQQANSGQKDSKVIYFSPQGRRLDHQVISELSQEQHLILVAGRYEGVDERLLEQKVDMQLSLGDFVLSGGELASMAVIDAVARLLPGVLGDAASASEESFTDGLLEHPQYTRPEEYAGKQVPQVLLSGNHQQIENWRLQQRLGKTWLNRPDLLAKKQLTRHEKELLKKFKQQHRNQD